MVTVSKHYNQHIINLNVKFTSPPSKRKKTVSTQKLLAHHTCKNYICKRKSSNSLKLVQEMPQYAANTLHLPWLRPPTTKRLDHAQDGRTQTAAENSNTLKGLSIRDQATGKFYDSGPVLHF